MIIKHYDNKRNRLPDRNVFDPLIREELNGNDTFECKDAEINVFHKYDYIVFCYKGKWYEYVVQKVVEDKRNGTTIYCENSIVELRDVIVTSPYEKTTYGVEAFQKALEGTNWHVGRNFSTQDVEVSVSHFTTLYDLIRKILDASDLELQTYIELQKNRFVRFFTLCKRVGRDNGTRLEYHGRLKSLKRIYEDKEIYTAIFPVGNTVEHEVDGKPIDPEKKKKENEAERERKRKEREEKNAQKQELIVNCSALNVRPDPSTNNTPIRVLHYGDHVTSEEIKKVGSYYWARLVGGGWIRKSYTQSAKASASKSEKAADRLKAEAEKLRLESSKHPLTITYSNGSPIMENKDATQKYGIEVDGGMAARIGLVKINTSQESELIRKAKELLSFYAHPRAVYEADAHEEGLDALSLGDGVIVIDDELGVELKARVIERRIEPDKHSSKIKLGNISEVASAMTKATKNAMSHTLSEVDKKINDERKNTTRTLMNSGSWVSYGSEPPETAAKGDVWYRYNPDESIDILVWDGEEWVLKMYDTFSKELEAHIGIVEGKADEFHQKAEAFQKEINQAIKDAGFSNYADSVNSMKQAITDLTNKTDPDAIKNIIKQEHYATEDSVHDAMSKINVDDKVKTYIETHEIVTPESYKRFVGEVVLDGEDKTLKEKLSQIEQTQSGFQTTVSDNQKKTDSRITQLSGVIDTKVSSDEMESRLSQTEKGISLKVAEAQKKYFDENGEPGEIFESYREVDGENLHFSDLRPAQWAKVFPNRVVHFKTNADDNMSLHDAIIDIKKDDELGKCLVEEGIEKVSVRSGEVWNDKSTKDPSKVLQEFRSENMHYIRESTSDVGWGKWKVAASDLMSGINVEAGGVEIFSNQNKLVVSPKTTYIADATITNAMIKDAAISTAKIGRIDASIANIVNITAANLAADKASFIRALFNGVYSNLEITGDLIKMMPHDNSGFGVIYKTNSLNFYKGYRRATIITYSDDKANIKGVLFASTYPDQSVALGCPSSNGEEWREKPEERRHFTIALEVGTDKPGVTSWGYKVHIYLPLNMHQNSIINQSDIRLKERIQPWDVRALEEIEKIDFIRFYWKERKDIDRPQDTTTEQYGLSAQSIPFLTTESEDGYLYVNQTKLLHLATKGVQELSEEVRQLKKENEELKERIARVEENVKGWQK